jgi:predicted  nucleic acid-binding Zn-ribbon protein
MPKHLEALGSFDKFRAPWETEAGDVDIDKDRLKKYLFDLQSDKAKAQDRAEDAEAKVAEADTKVKEADTARKVAEKKLAEADSTGEITSLTEKLTKETDRANTAELALLRRDVAAEKGLTNEQADRLTGSTKEELEKDADKVIELFGLNKPSSESDEDEDEDEDEDDFSGRTQVRLLNPADKAREDEGGDDKNYDYDKIVAGFSRRTL